MSQIRFIYSIQTNGEETPSPVTVQTNRILKIDEVGASIMLGDTVRIVRGRDLYIPPDDVAHGLMFGTDRQKLCKAWDTAVKKKAMSILNSYSRFFTAHEEHEERASHAQPNKELPPPSEPLEKPVGPSAAAPEPVLPETVQLANNEAEQSPTLPIYPHACTVSWDSIDAFIPKLVAKWFPSKASQVSARTIFGNYDESNEGWTFVLEDVREGDRAALGALLQEHDILREVALEAEWPTGQSMGSASFPLTTAISNHILATEFLPSLVPPFTYGVNLSIPNAGGLVLIGPSVTD